MWFRNAAVPACLLAHYVGDCDREGLTLIDLEIVDGIISQILPPQRLEVSPQDHDCRRGQLWPCFVDIHTHLDKGHSWPRNPNQTCSFSSAIDGSIKDSERWTFQDLYRRMEFALKCSYAHGTKAIRTHLNLEFVSLNVMFSVFDALKKQWETRITLQPSAFVDLSYYATENGRKAVQWISSHNGTLGAFLPLRPGLEAELDVIFVLAKEHKLELDFHTDENLHPESNTLELVAKTAIRHEFKGKILCGHCCSLSEQSPMKLDSTIALVKKAGIGIVSLPLCNLFLQDRSLGCSPRLRGTAPIHELTKAGIPVATSSDNCRDSFFGFGDHDGLEVFNQSVRICHLDFPYGSWPSIVTKTPAELMGLKDLGKIGVGLPADFIVFKGRGFSELLSRPQHDRIVIRNGKPIDTTLPDYSELDDLMLPKL